MSKTNKVEQWMPLYVADYLADTTRFTTEQHGAYVLLILDYWRNGPPPDRDATLAQIVKLTPAKWRAMRPELVEKFQVSGGVWKHKRVERELAKAREMQVALSQRGKAGAAARWGGDDDERGTGDASGNASGNATSNASGNAQAMPETMLADAPSPSTPTPLTQTPSPIPPAPAPKASAPPRKRASPKTSLPDGFAISDRVRKWAQEKGFSRLDEHFEHFVGKARAKSYTYADWDEGFMGAVREDWARLRAASTRTTGNQAAIEEAERRIFGAAEERDITDETRRI